MQTARNIRGTLREAVRWIADIAQNSGAIRIVWRTDDDCEAASVSYGMNRVVDSELHEQIGRSNPSVSRVEVVDGALVHICHITSHAP